MPDSLQHLELYPAALMKLQSYASATVGLMLCVNVAKAQSTLNPVESNKVESVVPPPQTDVNKVKVPPVKGEHRTSKIGGRVAGLEDMAPRWPGTLRLDQDYGEGQSLLNRILNSTKRTRSDDKAAVAYDTKFPEDTTKEMPPAPEIPQDSGRDNENSTQIDGLSKLLLYYDRSTKDEKQQMLSRQTQAVSIVYLAGGWQSADVYKDIDKTSEAGFPKVGFEGTNVHRTGVWYTKSGVSYEGFGLTVTYLQSDDKLIPRYLGVQNYLYGVSLPKARYYTELDVAANYTYSFKSTVAATVGYNLFLPLDKDFYGTNYDGELFGTITITAIPYVRPNITFSTFNSGASQLRGRHIEMRLDTVDFARFDYKSIHAELDPFVSLGVDDGLVNDGTGFSAAIIGIKAPIQVTEHMIFTVNGNYGLPINETGPNFRTDVGKLGVWGGIALTVKF